MGYIPSLLSGEILCTFFIPMIAHIGRISIQRPIPAGKWELLTRTQHFHDSSLFFDDDGRVYVFSGTGSLKELKGDLSDVKPDGVI